MSFKNDDNFEAEFSAMLQDTVNQVKSTKDPIALDKLKKIYKKNVPFALRNYVAAYLAQNGMHHGKNGRRNTPDGKWTRPRTYEGTEQRVPSPKVYIAEEHAATIFIGIGKSRRVFPRDLLGLVMNVAELGRERVGFIRVLENFSFVQLFKEDADRVIEKLNGYEYRGRKIPVSYSKKREELESEAPETEQTDVPSSLDQI
ncbi:MAG: DbpA RNA binding domain-containing protein [Treponemataceae bacterium]